MIIILRLLMTVLPFAKMQYICHITRVNSVRKYLFVRIGSFIRTLMKLLKGVPLIPNYETKKGFSPLLAVTYSSSEQEGGTKNSGFSYIGAYRDYSSHKELL